MNFTPLKLLVLLAVGKLKITLNVAFEFWHFPPITCLVTLFDRKLQVFKNSPKWTIFGIFIQLLSTQNVNVAHFVRIVE